MRIVFTCEHFSKKMGYIENCLPKALSRLGHDVHVVATNLQCNYRLGAKYAEIYEEFLGPVEVPCGTEILDGYTLHRLPHSKPLGFARIRGLRLTQLLRSLRPDVVQAHAVASWMPLEAALARPYAGYKLFTAAHQTASIVPQELKDSSRWSWARIKSEFRRGIPGRIVDLFSEKCYAATIDCAEMATKFYGVSESKIDLCPLGVDTEMFHPADDREVAQRRSELRQSLGINAAEILCIYTGRLDPSKNPLCLAQAVAQLRRDGQPYRALFLGAGTQRDAIEQSDGSVMHPFVRWDELPDFYRAADIGVWPRQESLSMLDAAASGIPVVVSDRMQATERVDGNGIMYKEDDPVELAAGLLSLKSLAYRQSLGGYGCKKIQESFSWMATARRRVIDYEAAIRRKPRSKPAGIPDATLPLNRPLKKAI